MVGLYRKLLSSIGLAEGTIEFLKRKPTLLDGTLNSQNLDLKGNFHIKNVSFEYPTRPGKIFPESFFNLTKTRHPANQWSVAQCNGSITAFGPRDPPLNVS